MKEYCGLLLALVLSGCGTQGAIRHDEQLQVRELSVSEKAALSRSLSSTLKDPNAAQFKWMPLVIRQRDQITDYCGLVNGKNSYGGFNGFSPFYAQLRSNVKGEFDTGEMRLMASPADDVSARAATGVCRDYGYSDFSQAK